MLEFVLWITGCQTNGLSDNGIFFGILGFQNNEPSDQRHGTKKAPPHIRWVP